jgi:hypothetical protein
VCEVSFPRHGSKNLKPSSVITADCRPCRATSHIALCHFLHLNSFFVPTQESFAFPVSRGSCLSSRAFLNLSLTQRSQATVDTLLWKLGIMSAVFPRASSVGSTPDSALASRGCHDVKEAARTAWLPWVDDPTPMVTHERSPESQVPMMPMEADHASVDHAQSRFFLATPSEICRERGMRPSEDRRERLSQFRSLDTSPEVVSEATSASTEGLAVTRDTPSPSSQAYHVAGDGTAAPRQNPADDGDDLIDEEVAGAVARARSRLPRFKLRPKPLHEQDCKDANMLFRA